MLTTITTNTTNKGKQNKKKLRYNQKLYLLMAFCVLFYVLLFSFLNALFMIFLPSGYHIMATWSVSALSTFIDSSSVLFGNGYLYVIWRNNKVVCKIHIEIVTFPTTILYIYFLYFDV